MGEKNVSLYNDTPYVPFQAHPSQQDIPLEITEKDIAVLRGLGSKYAEIAALPVQKEKKEHWKNVNDRKTDIPALWINEICWHEMNVDDELTNQCESEVGIRIETELRKVIYQWNHMPCDMVVEPVYYAPTIIENSGFGIETQADIAVTDPNNSVASRHYIDIIQTEDDIEKLKEPVITYHKERTKEFLELYQMIFDGIMPVETRGCTGFWFAPWDDIAMWKGADSLLLDLAMRPEFMHKLIGRLVDCYLAALDQLEELGLLASNNTNMRIGSGGYGYTNDLPTPESLKGKKIRTGDLWGAATPQIFSSVSPDMHAEFGVEYERRWLERFKISYYGCCEPLDGKIDVLSEIKNLRKISISPWANVANAAEQMRGKYVVSLKPQPAYFAVEQFDLPKMRAELTEQLKTLKGCNVEVILKDLSTVHYRPQSVWEWAQMAREVVEELF